METLTRRCRISVDEFLAIDKSGIFPSEARLELVDGRILEMKPLPPRHAEARSRLNESFVPVMDRASLRVQCPGRMGEHELPLPDVLLARRKSGGYASAHPVPDEVLLVVEIAETSLRFDREVKGRLYARQEIPEYWILNLVDDRLEVHRDPAGDEWRDRFSLGRGDIVAPLAFPDLAVEVGELLP